MEEQTQNSENLEIPSRWRRFFAYLLDLIINVTLIGLFINLIIIFSKKTTLGNIIVGVKTTDNNCKEPLLGKALLRFGIFYSTISIILFFILQLISSLTCLPFGVGNTYICIPDYDSITYKTVRIYSIFVNFIFIILIIINIIEIFFKCPTFIDKRLGIKRIYKKP